jgi:hypothetical protein
LRRPVAEASGWRPPRAQRPRHRRRQPDGRRRLHAPGAAAGSLLSLASDGQHLHPTAGTVFEKSSTSLRLWFYAAFVLARTGGGVSAKDLQRILDVT